MIYNIIPTHNRKELVLCHLKSIVSQSMSPEGFEVIVVCDACQDGTFEAIQAYSREAPYWLYVIEVDFRNRSRTRNFGASLVMALSTRNNIIVFNDDDCIPDAWLFQEYDKYVKPGVAGMGYSSEPNHFRHLNLDINQWESFVTSNMALSFKDFTDQKGFDEELILWGWEDHDLGYRLERDGIEMKYIPTARIVRVDNHDDEPRSLETNKPYLIKKYGQWPPPALEKKW